MQAISAAQISGASSSAASIKFEPFRDEYVPNLPPALWLMDTGCGHDLINDKMADDFPVKTLKKSSRIMFSTANGRIESRNVVPLYCSELAQLVHPYLLHDTPPVLSIGKRCMEQGFTFHWDPGRNPVMTNPEGMVVELEVEKNIPYLRAGSEFSNPRPARETKMVAIAPTVEQSGNSAPPPVTLCLAGEEVELHEDDDEKADDEVDENEYANSEELNDMMPQGEDTPEISDDEREERYQAFGDEEDMDPGGVILAGEMEDDGEAPEVISGADPDPQGHIGAGEEENADQPPPDPHPQARPTSRDEAQSLEHKLPHLPTNPRCEASTLSLIPI